MLKGKVVTLRPMDRHDVMHVHSMFCNPDVAGPFGYNLPISMVEMERVFQRCWDNHGKDGYYFSIEAPNGHFAGIAWIVNVDRVNGTCEIRIMVADPDDWNKGYGADAARILCEFAFAQARMERVYAHCLDFNTASVKGCLRMGFKLEGRLRSAFVKDGARHDALVLGLLRGELTGASPGTA